MNFKKYFTFKVSIHLSFFIAYCSAIRVCSNKQDYYNPFSKNCVDDPDGGDTPVNILKRWNCTAEEYNVTTSDGYIISIIRAYKKLNPDNYPVLFVHGIYGNSRIFLSSKQKTLAYLLVNNGHQIFLVNLRGTMYSTETVNGLTQNDYAYWKFSWHHLGIYDVSKSLDFIFEKTAKPAIVVGYSMGATAVTVYLSLNPEKALTRVKAFIAMSPVVFMDRWISSLVGKLAIFWKFLQPFIKRIYNGKIFPPTKSSLNFCKLAPVTMQLCYTKTVLIFGIDYSSLDYARRPVLIENNPDSLGEFVVAHYAQIINSGQFQQFDYGSKENKKAYNGSTTPPLYPIQNINVPVTLAVGKNDWIVPYSRAKKFWSNLTASSRCKFITIDDSNFAHDSFVSHINQLTLVNNPLFTQITRLSKGTCS